MRNPFKKILRDAEHLALNSKTEIHLKLEAIETLSHGGILFTNTDSINKTYTSIQYYYSLALGEELTIKDKTSISMFYNLGSINNTSYQQFVASIGYWILTDILLDFQIKSHINQSLTEYHLVSNIKF